jgi:hypothetical protein
MRYLTRFIVRVKRDDLINLFEKMPAGTYYVVVDADSSKIIVDNYEIPCNVRYLAVPHSRLEINDELVDELKKHNSDTVQVEGTKFDSYLFCDHNVSL